MTSLRKFLQLQKGTMKDVQIKRTTPEESKAIGDAMRELIKSSNRNAYKVIVAGGRDFEDYEYMSAKLDELFWLSDNFDENPIKIISGMAEGADMLAIRYADEHELTKILFPANWKSHPRMAGILRNEDMLTIATHLVAFWDGKSHGTKHIIDIAREKGIPVWVFGYK